MDVHPSLARDRGRHLLDDPEPERFQDRHEVREIDLAAGLVELDPSQALSLRLVADPDEEPLRRRLELLEHHDVVDDQIPLVVGLVVVREPGRVLLHQGERAARADAPRERVEEVVLPGARQDLDLPFELLVAHVGDRLARCDVDREEDPRRFRLSQGEVVVDRRAVEALEEETLEGLAEVRVEPIARQGDHDRHVPAVQVAADQDADAPVLLELQEPGNQPPQLLGGGLEELVLGERLEEGDDGLVVVRPGDQIFRGDQLLQLVVQQRRLRGRLHVRLAREEADQPRLTADRPVGEIDPDPDVVHAGATMDGRVRLGLRVDQELPVLDAIPDIRCDVREQGEVRERRLLDVREDPEPAVRHRADRASALRIQQLVLAVAEQDEIQLEEPVEELRHLIDDL